MNPEALYRRYEELQQYVGWSVEDARRVHSVAAVLDPFLPALVDDFYEEIARHPDASKVITGGMAQVNRLKGTLVRWVRELLKGPYDQDYVARRWQVGWRHVEIGLDQVYTNVALARLRRGLLRRLEEVSQADLPQVVAVRSSLNTLIDLDLAIIEDAYQAEYLARQQQIEKQRAKERTEAAFRTLVEAAPCMIIILRPDGTILYFSPFAEDLTGYAAEEVLGKNYFPLFIPSQTVQQEIEQDIQKIMSGVPTRGYENVVQCKDDSQRWMIWNAQRLADYEGGPALLAVGQDLTSSKQAQEMALQSARLAAIGQMVTGLAHESGNALARSRACLEMLTWEVQDRQEALDLIERIIKAQDHLQQLYEEVRGYAAPIKLDREEWDLSAIWRQAWDNLSLSRREKETSLKEHRSRADLRCAVDHFRLDQVFRNIFENALAACTSPVVIDITCSETQIRGRPAIRVSVRDNGPGLGPEQKQRIFEPFFTTKTKGTGLGMAIARRIVEAHGGQLAVGTGKGQGAEIIITVPRAVP